MKEVINQQYINLYAENDDFRIFIRKMDKLSADEIVALYGLKIDIISYCSGLSKMPA